MSVLNPEVVYSDSGVFCEIESGKWYYPLFTNMGNYNQICEIKNIKPISLTDFDENTMISAATGKKVVLCIASNGVNLVVSFYNLNNSLYASYGFEYNGVYTWKGNISGNPGFTIAAAKYYGVKIALVTSFPQTPVIEGSTKAEQIAFALFIPIQQGSALQSWTHVGNGIYRNDYVNGVPDNVDQPNHLYYPENLGFGLVESLFPYTDLNSAVTDINNANPNNPITVDDIFETMPENPNPPQDDDPSGTGGGGGSYTPTGGDGTGGYAPDSEPIDFPTLPTGSAITSGSIKSFLVSEAIIQAVFQRLWNNNIFDVLTWQKIIEEPMDAIVSLHCIPCVPQTGGTANIQLGNIDTEVGAPVITNQYITIDCGTLSVSENWGSALDYSPYTKIEIFVPGVGIRPLKAEDVMRQTLHLKYNFDVLTGNFVASLKCGQSVLYKFTGNMKASIPLTSRIYSALEAVMKGAGQTAGAYCTGSMQAENKKDATSESIREGGQNAAIGMAINSAINVAMSKVNIQRSGDISGSTSLLDDFVPYLIIHRPIQSLASRFNTFKGYPSNITALLSTLSGYTEIEYINLQNIPNATEAEMNEIKNLLRNGVIF